MPDLRETWRTDTWVRPFLGRYRRVLFASIGLGVVALIFAVGLMFVSGYLIDAAAALESVIGSIDWQIYSALHGGPTGALFRRIAKTPAVHWESSTKRSGEEAYRLAKRTIVAKVDLQEFVYQVAPTPPLTGLGRLSPRLQPIAEALSNSTYRTALVLGIAKAAPIGPTPYTPLESIGVQATAGQAGANLIAGEANNLNPQT